MILMGVVNLTPDSFREDTRAMGPEAAMRRVAALRDRGCSIIDFGAVSTRPGAADVPLEEEWRRLESVLSCCKTAGLASPTVSPSTHEVSRSLYPTTDVVPPLSRGCRRSCEAKPAVSIDTTRAEIVRRAYGLIGRFIVNDISAGEDDPEMLPTVSELGLPYIAMHKRGNPRTMDSKVDYPHGVVRAVDEYFTAFASKAERKGVRDWILDPGFGFAKTNEQNWELLENLEAFRHFGRPILAGVADKRFTRTPNPFATDNSGSDYAERLAAERGADILRVH